MEKVNFKLCDPEKEVESEVLRWAFRNRWSLDVYDSKGTYSKAKGRYSQNTGMKRNARIKKNIPKKKKNLS